MSVYNYSGDIISNVYSYDGDLLDHVYDVYGNLISASDMTVVKVMSYNVGGFYIGSGTNVPTNRKSDYENLLRNTISKNKCDILVMEEYWNTFCADGTTAESILDDYYSNINSINNTMQYAGKCICMNETPTLVTSFNYTKHSSYQNGVIVNVVNLGGHDVYVLGCHLDWQEQSYQVAQVQDILSYLSDKEYFILCGDFNPGIRTTEDRTSEDYIDVCKPFIDAGYNMVNWKESFVPTSYNGTSAEDSTTILCLDNIITSSNITIYRSYTDTTKLTDNLHDTIDHIPVVATLIIN